MKSYLYSRISTLQQTKGFGIDRQVQTVTDFLKYATIDSRLGYQLDVEDFEVLESDLGKSAYKGNNWKPNSSLGRFYKDVVSGRITSGVLICENVDRLVRMSNYEASNKLSTLITNGIDIIEVESGMCFSNKIPESATILNMSISRAYSESKRKSDMATKSWANRTNKLKDSGRAVSKVCPRWLTVKDGQYVLDEKQAETLLYIHQMYLEGHGNSALVRRLNAAKRLDNGKPWTTITLHRVLRDERLTGRMVMGKTRKPIPVLDDQGNKIIENGKVKTYVPVEIIDDAYPVVVPRELFNQVQAMISEKEGSKVKKTTKYMRNIFNGVSRCSSCGEALVADKNGHGKLFYVCLGKRHKKACNSVGIPYEAFERTMLENLSQMDWQRIYTGNTDMEAMNQCRVRLVAVEREIAELEGELESSDEDMVLALVRAIKKKKAVRDEIQGELNSYVKAGTDNVTFNPDLKRVLNQEEVELRQDVNVELRKIIKYMKVGRMDRTITVQLQYYTDVVSHLIFIDSKTGELLSRSHLTNDLIYESDSVTIDLTGGKWDIKGDKFTEWDQFALEVWKEIIEQAVDQAQEILKNRI